MQLTAFLIKPVRLLSLFWVDESNDDAATISNVIGGVSSNGEYTGLHALLNAQSITGQVSENFDCSRLQQQQISCYRNGINR